MKRHCKNLIRLSNLPKRVQDLNKVLDVYLNPGRKRKIEVRNNHLIFCAVGIGYDGDEQMLFLDNKGRIGRKLTAKNGFIRLPAETGKVLWMLKEMGYELEPLFSSRAMKYQNFIATGISNVDENGSGGLVLSGQMNLN